MGKSIAIAGKGGTGKTTLAALIIDHLCATGQGPVLAIDADADANLGTLLGREPRQTVGELREEVREEFKRFPAGMSKAQYVEAGLHQIIEEGEGFDLISMGRGEGAGCYCYLNSLIRKFSEDLLPSYRWVVIDNEAGLEHLSRRTSTSIDSLIVVVNDNPITLNTARSIHRITQGIPNAIFKQYIVTNAVAPERRGGVEEKLASIPMPCIGHLPRDPAIEAAICNGGCLRGLPDSPAKQAVKAILDKVNTTT